MNIGDTFNISLGYHYGGMLSSKSTNKYRFKIIDIKHDDISWKKDLMICQEIDYGYKECFHRMDLEARK